MAKKIKVAHAVKASESLKKRKIEHVLVEYEDDAFLVVMNKHANSAKAALTEDGLAILKMKSIRHYADKASKHSHYQPTFDCVCRGCGKTFTHMEKDAKWCSKACKSNYRRNKKTASA